MTKPTLIISVVRALNLLDAVGSSATPLTAKQLSRQADLPLSTTYHLLRTLLHEDYLRRTDHGYVLGQGVDALTVPGRQNLPSERVRQVLNELHAVAKAACYVATLADERISIIDIVDSATTPRVDLWVGLHDAAHATALGKAILASMHPARRRDYLATHPLADLTPRTMTCSRTLLNQLSGPTETVMDDREYAADTVCLAAPLPSAGLTAAVAISMPADHTDQLRAQEADLKRAASLLALSGAG